MKCLIVSDAIKATMPQEINRLYNFIAGKINFTEMKISYDDNDNPLSFIVVIVIDDYPPVKFSPIGSISSAPYYYQHLEYEILNTIKNTIAICDDMRDNAISEINSGLANLSPPGIKTESNEDTEIEF